jgi:hypothetical protein
MKVGHDDYKKGRQINGKSYESGKTVTPQIGKQYGIVSGFDNSFNQELQNLICTHSGNNATCIDDGTSTPVDGSTTDSEGHHNPH